tara:strand:+ start:632 stop:1333 length:702 start_codon:yes stop_codon:yes gene_type:complete
MFELNPQMDITAVVDIGPQERSAIVIDNFYENPDEVRNLALKLPRSPNINFTNHPPAPRAVHETVELRKNLESLLEELFNDKEHWGRPTDMPWLRRNFDLMWFMVEYMNEKTIDEDVTRLIPYQCWYEHNPSPFQFTMDVFLNTQNECFGGINIWNMAGRTSIVEDCKTMYASKTKFDIRKDIYESKFAWARELTFGMKYNRAVIMPADILKADILDTCHFDDIDRMVQKMFL